MRKYACVCNSGGLTQDLHNPLPQNLAWAPHFTRARHQASGQIFYVSAVSFLYYYSQLATQKASSANVTNRFLM